MERISALGEAPALSVPPSVPPSVPAAKTDRREAILPHYLQSTYWWAYLHPRAVWLFERQWLVNLILWGNFARLRDAALDALGRTIRGRTLQVACVYGDFSPTLARRLAPDARLHLVDVAPIQLDNARAKLGPHGAVTLARQDSAELGYPDGFFDQVVLFFLLHEQPEEVRARTVREALRVTRPGGRVVFVDYHQPAWWNPLRYLMTPVLKWLEPFALDLWRHDIDHWLPPELGARLAGKATYFGGLYQRVVYVR